MTVTVLIILLFLSAGTVLYTYYGYPTLMRWLAGRAKPLALPNLTDSCCPEAVFLMAAHNEQAQIERKIRNCLEQNYPPDKLRVVIVSDGSTDDTAEIARELGRKFEHQTGRNRVDVIESPTRIGKAACLNLAMSRIESPLVILVDVRQRLSTNAARSLLGHFSNPSVGAVTGELRLEHDDCLSGDDNSFGQGVSSYWQQEVALRRNEAAVHSVVGATGAIYALRRAAFVPIPDCTILDDVLIPMNTVLAGYQVRFDSRAHAYDRPVSDLGHERRRKVRTLAGNFSS